METKTYLETNQELPATIEVIFAKEDLENAERYNSNEDCLLATALKRLGYKNISVGGYGETSFDYGTEFQKNYAPKDKFEASLVEFGGLARYKPYYKEEVVGMKVVLEMVGNKVAYN